jgi:hypothetical protein
MGVLRLPLPLLPLLLPPLQSLYFQREKGEEGGENGEGKLGRGPDPSERLAGGSTAETAM